MAKDKDSTDGERWLVFITSLPVDDPAARMRILRTLDSLGCAAMREGVFALPDTPPNRQGLTHLIEHISRINGSAHLLQVLSDKTQDRTFRGFFDRTRKYVDLVKSAEGLKLGFGVSDPGAIARVLNKQRREFEALSALDFFPSEARERAARALSEMDNQVRALMFPDAPKGPRATASGRQYFKRVWATRRPLWTDRLASAWLIRRFIDPEASLVWLDKGQACPVTAVGFAFEGAPFCNSKARVTFEELLANFALENNAALARIGRLVRALDVGGVPVPEAAGVETLLQGARRRSSNEDELLRESEKTFDLLYEAYYEPPGKA